MSLVTRINDLTNNTSKYYEYDALGKLIYSKSDNQSIRYKYDNLNNIQTKQVKNNVTSKEYFYQYDYETAFTREKFLMNLTSNYFDELIIPMYQGQGLNGLEVY